MSIFYKEIPPELDFKFFKNLMWRWGELSPRAIGNSKEVYILSLF